MVVIAVSLALLTLVAGMFLLAKTQKELLGNFFKFVSYFIIGASLICLVGIGTRCIMMCNEHHGSGMMGFPNSNMGRCEEMEGGCAMHHNKACCKGKMESCTKDMKNMHDDDEDAKKDSTDKK